MSVGTLNEVNRDRWVAEQLTKIPSGHTLIDVGAGPCRYKKHCVHLAYTAQDFSKYDGVGDSAGLQNGSWDYPSIDIVSDIANIPVADGSFDVALCTEVLEHVPSPILALREMDRVLKKTSGATMLLTAPFACLTHQSPYFFSTGFSEYFYRTHLDALGFDVEIEKNGNYFEYLAQELRRLPQVAVQFASAGLTNEILSSISTTLGALEQLSARDSGSNMLLCYGLHVRATRR